MVKAASDIKFLLREKTGDVQFTAEDGRENRLDGVEELFLIYIYSITKTY